MYGYMTASYRYSAVLSLHHESDENTAAAYNFRDMPNQDHLNILQAGVKTWNEWRRNHPDETPDLTNAQLCRVEIIEASEPVLMYEAPRRYIVSKADFGGVNFRDAELSGADLRDTNLSGADLRGANLSKANLRGANLQ